MREPSVGGERWDCLVRGGTAVGCETLPTSSTARIGSGEQPMTAEMIKTPAPPMRFAAIPLKRTVCPSFSSCRAFVRRPIGESMIGSQQAEPRRNKEYSRPGSGRQRRARPAASFRSFAMVRNSWSICRLRLPASANYCQVRLSLEADFGARENEERPYLVAISSEICATKTAFRNIGSTQFSR